MTRSVACLLLWAALAPLPAQGRPAAGRQEIGRTVAGTPVFLETKTLRRLGDTVTVWGDPAEGAPHAEEWAEWAETIGYEIVTRVAVNQLLSIFKNKY
jgi:hypothetical protein